MSAAAAEHLLDAIAGEEDEGGLIEVRPEGGRSKWIPAHDPERAAATAIRVSRSREAWIGMAVRRRFISPKTGQQFGGSSAIERAWVLSADLDSDDALDALDRFEPSPSFVLTSGSLTDTGRSRLHAHWALSRAVPRSHLAAYKLRLALALGSDQAVKDVARVMRAPGMRNHKHRPPTECVSVTDHPERLYLPAQVLANCPEPKPANKAGGRRREVAETARSYGEFKQAQERIPPREYVEQLAGVEVNERGKAQCPFHDDSTPSLHCYPSPEEGFYCFGCRRGGDIYTFAALLRGIPQSELYGDTFDRVWAQVREFFGMKVAVLK
ncbi:MAG TPA: CHC2 zinc finger domain-containing protein [Solirubrobacteraceae bacterium]|nr:CHC2 zinc finger domain-containing protein [Solirubrobacteraceae bacterium]